jgi:anthranilate/para-aminobenzoate synthase component II
MSSKVIICDFEDSFTYNILSCLREYYPRNEIEIIPKKKLLVFLQTIASTTDHYIIILGPGPGHPDEYEFLYPSLKRLFVKENFFIMGICLGHQILCALRGLTIEHSYSPVHGHTEQYLLGSELSKKLQLPSLIEVQRYNSLAVKISDEESRRITSKGGALLVHKGEVIILKDTNLISYQFHPESVGTTCPKSFFEVLNPMLI